MNYGQFKVRVPSGKNNQHVTTAWMAPPSTGDINPREGEVVIQIQGRLKKEFKAVLATDLMTEHITHVDVHKLVYFIHEASQSACGVLLEFDTEGITKPHLKGIRAREAQAVEAFAAALCVVRLPNGSREIDIPAKHLVAFKASI